MIKESTLSILAALPLIAWVVIIVFFLNKERKETFPNTAVIWLYGMLALIGGLAVFATLMRGLGLVIQ